MDRKSAITAISSILKMVPHDERHSVWWECAPPAVPVDPELSGLREVLCGTHLGNITENAKTLYYDLGISRSVILSHLVKQLESFDGTT